MEFDVAKLIFIKMYYATTINDWGKKQPFLQMILEKMEKMERKCLKFLSVQKYR